MNTTTRHQVEEAFLEVSRGAARKTIYALRAEQEGNSQLAKLFRAIGLSEKAQAQRLLLQLRGQTGTNKENCQTAFTKEIPSLLEKYEEAAAIAGNTGERAMQSAFSQSTRVQRMHLSLKKKLDKDSAKDNSYHVCSFCGFIMEDHAPEQCPICTAPSSRFIET